MTKVLVRKDRKKIVRELLKQFGTPVDLDPLLEHHGITLRVEEMEDDVSGFLVMKESGAAIAVNKCHHPNRQRFTIAHECGHFFLHANEGEPRTFVDMTPTIYMRNCLASSGTSEMEIAANWFAAELLMPESYLRENFKGDVDIFYDTSLQELANKLRVSVQALSVRLSALDLVPRDLYGRT